MVQQVNGKNKKNFQLFIDFLGLEDLEELEDPVKIKRKTKACHCPKCGFAFEIER